MIHVTVYKRESITGLKVCGHAGYAKYGSDIICAAVSVLMTNLLNSLEALTDEAFEFEAEEESGRMEVSFEEPVSHDAELLVRSCVLGLEAIAAEHRDYVRLKYKEV